MIKKATRIRGFEHLRFVEEPSLSGERTAFMEKDGDEIHLSPAMFALLKTDFESLAKNLKVRIVHHADLEGRGQR